MFLSEIFHLLQSPISCDRFISSFFISFLSLLEPLDQLPPWTSFCYLPEKWFLTDSPVKWVCYYVRSNCAWNKKSLKWDCKDYKPKKVGQSNFSYKERRCLITQSPPSTELHIFRKVIINTHTKSSSAHWCKFPESTELNFSLFKRISQHSSGCLDQPDVRLILQSGLEFQNEGSEWYTSAAICIGFLSCPFHWSPYCTFCSDLHIKPDVIQNSMLFNRHYCSHCTSHLLVTLATWHGICLFIKILTPME